MTLIASLTRAAGDFRAAVRALKNTPLFSLFAFASLALGLGANLAIFSLLNALLLKPLAVRAPEQLVQLLSNYPGEPRHPSFSFEAFRRFREKNHVFSEMIGTVLTEMPVQATDGVEEPTRVELVTENYFDMLGVQAATGRTLRDEAQPDRVSGEPGVVVSWAFWNGRLRCDANAVGQRVRLRGTLAVIVGIADRRFRGLQPGIPTQVWIALRDEPLIDQPSLVRTGRLSLAPFGRLRSGLTLRQAQAEMAVLYQPFVEEWAARSGNPVVKQVRLEVEPAAAGGVLLRDHFRSPLLVLITITVLLLVTVWINLAGLFLARAVARDREVSLRLSLGASRLQLLRLLAMEGLVIGASGALGAVVVGYWGARSIVAMLSSGRLPPGFPEQLHLELLPDVRVVAFTLVVAVISALVFTFTPMIAVLRVSPYTALRPNRASGPSRGQRRVSRVLVLVQLALSLAVLSTATGLTRYLMTLRNQDLGFRTDHVLLASLRVTGSAYAAPRVAELSNVLLARVREMPQVIAAARCAPSPISGAAASRFVAVDGHVEEPSDRRYISVSWVTPDYFRTLGTELRIGRDFTNRDDASRPTIAIVNQSFARYYFSSASAIGRHFHFDQDEQNYEIVGVAADAKYSDLHEPAPRAVYLNLLQGGPAGQFAIRTSISPGEITGDLRRLQAEVIPGARLDRVITLDDQLDRSLVTERLIRLLAVFFAGLGALLVGIGVYGLFALTVAKRSAEFGVRLAVGATGADIARMVLFDAARLTALGVVVGLMVTLWSGRLLMSWISGLPGTNAIALAGGAVGILLVVVLATAVPVRRAVRVDPVEILRSE